MADPKWQSHMRPHYGKLTNGLRVSGPLLDHAYQSRLLTHEERSTVDRVQPNTEEQKARCLLELLVKKPPRSFDKFCSVLERKEVGFKHMADILRKPTSRDRDIIVVTIDAKKARADRPIPAQSRVTKVPVIHVASDDETQDDTALSTTRARPNSRKRTATGVNSKGKRPANEQAKIKEFDSSEVTDGQIEDVCKNVAASYWFALAKRLLGYHEAQNLFSANTSQTMKDSEKLEGILRTWKDREGRNATVGTLRQAAKKAGVGGAVETVLDRQ